jgi:hypothetical protein
VRIIIKCPESDSPLTGRIHLRRLSLRPTSNLLQSGGGPSIECNVISTITSASRGYKENLYWDGGRGGKGAPAFLGGGGSGGGGGALPLLV